MVAQERVLDDVLGFRDRAEHPVGDREQIRPQLVVSLHHCRRRNSTCACDVTEARRGFSASSFDRQKGENDASVCGRSERCDRRTSFLQLVERGHEVDRQLPLAGEVADRLSRPGRRADRARPARRGRGPAGPSRPPDPTRSSTRRPRCADLSDLKNPDKSFAATNRLRTDGTDYLLDAASRRGRPALHRAELHQLDETPARADRSGTRTTRSILRPRPRAQRHTPRAIEYLERAVSGSSDILWALWRCVTEISTSGNGLRARRSVSSGLVGNAGSFPIVGGGAGVWSFVHIEMSLARPCARFAWGTGDLQHHRRRAGAGVEVAAGACGLYGAQPPRQALARRLAAVMAASR